MLKIPKIYRPSLIWFGATFIVTIAIMLLDSSLSTHVLELNEQKKLLAQQSNLTSEDSQAILAKLETYKEFSGKISGVQLVSKGCSKDNSKVYQLTWQGYEIADFSRIFNEIIAQGLIKIIAFKISRPHKLDHDYLYNVALGQSQPVFTGIVKFAVYNHNHSIANSEFCR